MSKKLKRQGQDIDWLKQSSMIGYYPSISTPDVTITVNDDHNSSTSDLKLENQAKGSEKVCSTYICNHYTLGL